MPSFKEVNEMLQNTEKKQSEPVAAASKILASHAIKDKRIAVRVNSATYDQFNLINSKLGTSNGSVINMMIAEYIMKNKSLLD